MKGKRKKQAVLPAVGPALANGEEGQDRPEKSPAPASPPPSPPPPAQRDPQGAAPTSLGGSSGASPPLPGSSAREALEALRGRLLDLCPGWASAPEDPVNVLLEVVAEYAGELRDEISAIEERAVPELLLRLGIEPRPPRPARGVVVFEPAPSSPSADSISVPAGTPVVAVRPQGASTIPPRIAFETVADARIGSARLVRALAVDGHEVEELPVEGTLGGARSPAGLFSKRLRAGRELYLGDGDFAELRAGRKAVRIDWPGYPAVLARASWEYRVDGGWRGLPVRLDRVEGDPPVLRMVLRGPLSDLTSELRERAELPWIRCALGAEALDLAAPLIAGIEEGAGPEAKGRPIARIFLAGPDESLDLSFEPRLLAPAASPDLDPAVYFGWEAPRASTAYIALREIGGGGVLPGEGLPEPPAPGLAWEYSREDGWEAIPGKDLDDRTSGFTRSGIFTAVPPGDWEGRKLFGDELFWVRARWVEGERISAVAAGALFSRAAEAIQGRTIEELPIGRASEIDEGVLAIPALNEGEVDGFDRIELRGAGVQETWERAADLQGLGPEDRRFVVARGAEGGLEVRFGDGIRGRLPPSGVEGDVLILAKGIRVGIGSQGNIPARTPLVLGRDIAGIASVWNPLPAWGGEDRESLPALRARACAEWRTGGRAVTASDFDRWVRALLPGIEGAIAGPDPIRPGGILVVPVPRRPRKPGRLSPALLRALEKELGGRAPLGTPVRVAEPSFIEVMAEVSAAPPLEEREGLRARILEGISRFLDPAPPGGKGSGFSSRRGLNESRIGNIIAAILGERSPAVIRFFQRDGRPFTPFGPQWPPDLILELVGVRFAGEP